MRKIMLPVGIALALLVATVVGVGAITYGEPDNGEHPYVGMMLFYVQPDDSWYSCTGALLDETTVLTAGHCTADVGTDLVYEGPRGGHDMWITFDEQVDLTGWPTRAEYPDPAERNSLRLEWLNANDRFIRGIALPHPGYLNGGFPDTYDVGVIQLDEPASGYGKAVLADIGVLDALSTKRGFSKDVLFETAGYGIQEVKPDYMSEDWRYKATSMFVNLRSHLTDGFNLHTSNNPSQAQGRGGSCFGDSGGPVMFDDTNKIVAVVSFGMNNNCKGADWSYRVDTADSQEFIGDPEGYTLP
jgi:hypothetical protein